MKRRMLFNLVLTLSLVSMTLFANASAVLADGGNLVGTWIQLAPTGSPPNQDAGKQIIYDVANNRLIVFTDGRLIGNQVWILTNANGLGGTPAWVQLQPTGNAPISNAYESVVYDAAANQLIVYGGCMYNCSPALSGVFVLTHANGLGGTPAWSQLNVTNPQDRVGQGAVFDPANNLMITFAGHHAFFRTDEQDTRILSHANGLNGPSAWSTLSTSGAQPGIRGLTSVLYDQPDNRLMVFGGVNFAQACCPYIQNEYNDLWVLQNANGIGGTPTWTQLTPAGTLPAPRAFHSAVYDPTLNRMIVFGGETFDEAAQASTSFGDLWVLSQANGLGGAPVWSEITQTGDVPGPRVWATAALDSVNQRMMMMGGLEQPDASSNNVWVLALSSSATSLTASTTATNIYPGDPISVDLNIQNASNLYAAQADCTADAAVIRPQSATFGNFFDPINRLLGANNADAAAGVWSGAISQRSPALPLAGDGLFATVHYLAQAPGSAAIACDVVLSDPDGFTQPVTFTGASVTVLPFAIVNGVVKYQGRTVHSSITVTGPIPPVVNPDGAGNFTLSTKSGTSLPVIASAPGYLSNGTNVTATSGQTVTLPATTLRGGDANNDHVINIGDATLVAANFGKTVPPGDARADINADGKVNIQDLAILGSNYGLAGTQPW